MINPKWLELPMSRTNFHGPKDVRAIEVWLYNWCTLLRLTSGFLNPREWCSPRQSRGEHHFRGLRNLDVSLNRMHQVFCYRTICSCPAAVTKAMVLDLSQAICYMTILAVWQAIFNKQQLILANINICKNLLQPVLAHQRRPLLAVR